MKRPIRFVLDRLPYVGRLRRELRELREPGKLGSYPAEHYYSPIPSHEDVMQYIQSPKRKSVELPDISLNKDGQFALLQEYRQYYDDLPFPEHQAPDCRYYYKQEWFTYTDAIFLYSFLRKNQPGKIIEVGSGFSSAVMLDTLDKFFSRRTDVTFIEPEPRRLQSILRPQDKDRVQILAQKVQDVPVETLTSLGPGDLLFIDSTHVVKCGSDVQFLMFEIIPKLSPGVFVHFHDIFFPFEYPSQWLAEGRYWNEDYFLRAFLAYNGQWSIYFFNSYVTREFQDFIKQNMPLCSKNQGGSLYLRKSGNG